MKSFAGIGRLTRLALRRDRVMLPVWICGTALLFMAFAAATMDAYPTQQDWIAHAQANTPLAVARLFNGVIYGVNQGATIMSETLVFTTIFPALMSIFAITRHTRQNEELGRSELVGSTAVGHFASLGAALLVVVSANIALGLFSALGLIAVGLDVAGSFAAGAVMAAVGISFTAITALIAQLAIGARTTNALAGAVLGAAFLVRGVGDAMATVAPNGLTASSAWPIWVSPIGWTEKVFPYTENNGWPIVLSIGFFVLLSSAAFAITAHRDLGGGIIATRKGPADAPKQLLGSLGLAWRLQRGSFIGWLVGMVAVAITMGAVGNQITSILDSSQSIEAAVQQLGGANLVASYFVLVMNIMGVVVAGFIVQGLLRLRSEEASGRLEMILTTAVGRTRWMVSNSIISVFGVTAIILFTGLATGLTYGIISHDIPHQMIELTKLALLQLPGILVVGGVVALAFGLIPRATIAVGWTYLTICLLIMYVGILLKLPTWLIETSPFSHLPTSYSRAELWPALVLLGIAAALYIAGIASFRRRNTLI